MSLFILTFPRLVGGFLPTNYYYLFIYINISAIAVRIPRYILFYLFIYTKDFQFPRYYYLFIYTNIFLIARYILVYLFIYIKYFPIAVRIPREQIIISSIHYYKIAIGQRIAREFHLPPFIFQNPF